VIPVAERQLFRELCESAQRVVVTTHINPDGDAIGSQVSLARFLDSLGKEVRLINRDPTPDILRFIEDPARPIEVYRSEIHDAVLGRADLLVLVDNSAPDRLGRMEPVMAANAARTLCIDHHPMRDAPWGRTIVDEEACATAAMVYELASACGWTPDRAAAEAIYVGLATDTGFFRFNSTSARSHELAARLPELGVDPAKVYEEIYERNPVAFTRLLGHALASLRTEVDGEVVAVSLPSELMRGLGAEAVDTSEIHTALLAIDGVRVALLYRELSGGRVKVSLRSKGDLDVHRLASEFGGGGHRNASGIVMSGDLDEVAGKVGRRVAALLGAAEAS
jgi:phosphoesterase RecJ-like protein